MKKLIIAAAILLGSCQMYAQTFTGGVNIGVNVPTAGMALPGFVQVEKNGTAKAIVATLGAGINFNGELGYEFNNNIAFNVGFGVFKGFKGGFYQHFDTDPAPGFQNNGAKADITLGSSFTHISPNVVISANSKPGKLRPYGRFGLIIGTGKATVTSVVTGVPGRDVLVYEGGLSTGFLGGLGLQKSLGDKMNLFAEITTKTVTSSPQKATNTETFTGGEKAPVVNYREEIPYGYNGPDELTFTLPYSSVGLTLGLSFKF